MVGEKLFRILLKRTISRKKTQLSENNLKTHLIFFFSEFGHMNLFPKPVAGFKLNLNILCYE